MLYLGHPDGLDTLDPDAQVRALAWHIARTYGAPKRRATEDDTDTDDLFAGLWG